MSKAGKYIGDFSNISTVTQIISAILKYISANPNISAIFPIYQFTDKSDNKSCSERDSFYYKKSVYLDKFKGYIIF